MKKFTKFGKEDIKGLFLKMCSSFLSNSDVVSRKINYVLIGINMMGEETSAIIPVLYQKSKSTTVKKTIEEIIEQSGKEIRFTNIFTFEVIKNEVRGSIEEIGEGIIFQQIFKNTVDKEEFIDKSYQIFE